MTTDSGTYKFELDFVEKKELPEAPLTISGPLEELKNLEIGLFAAMCKLSEEGHILLAASMLRWHDRCKQEIRDMEFELNRYQAGQDSGALCNLKISTKTHDFALSGVRWIPNPAMLNIG